MWSILVSCVLFLRKRQVTFEKLFGLAQLHPVDLVSQSWLQQVPRHSFAVAVFLQGRLRCPELRRWFGHHVGPDVPFDKELFRQTWKAGPGFAFHLRLFLSLQVPIGFGSEVTTELGLLSHLHPYASASRLLESCAP